MAIPITSANSASRSRERKFKWNGGKFQFPMASNLLTERQTDKTEADRHTD